MQSDNESSSTYLRSLASGAIAGTLADLSLFPLDTLKTRLQSSQGFIAAGGFRGCYSGIGSALAASAPNAAIFFVTYDTAKRYLVDHATNYSNNTYREGPGKHDEVTAKRRHSRFVVGAHILASSTAEVAACIIRVPAEVVKQRAQAGQSGGRSLNALKNILSTYNAADGKGAGPIRVIRELYRGWGVTLLRELPFTVIQFPLWEALKGWHVKKFGPQSTSKASSKAMQMNPGDAIGAIPAAAYGSVSGAIAAGITTPLDVLKTRLMLARERVGAIEMLRRIIDQSGPRALLAGLAPRTLWISVGGFIFLGSYQWAWNALGGREDER